MSRKVRSGVTSDGTRYVIEESKRSGITVALATLLGLSSIISVLYGVASYSRPEMIDIAFSNKTALISLLAGVVVMLWVAMSRISDLGSATFEKMERSTSVAAVEGLTSGFYRGILGFLGVEISGVSEPDKGKKPNEQAQEKDDFFTYDAISDDQPFPAYVSRVLKSLSAYAKSSEITATRLLDKGVAFMAGGLVFYILAIIIWQIFANLTSPDAHVMYVGMAACSMTFLVIEFLAAWFFKQYRYYVEISLACLRVRSVYDRYLLGYYAAREFSEDAGEKIRGQLADMLKEDVKWPSYKNGSANDFNYMVETMGSANATMERVRDMFKKNKKKKPGSKVE